MQTGKHQLAGDGAPPAERARKIPMTLTFHINELPPEPKNGWETQYLGLVTAINMAEYIYQEEWEEYEVPRWEEVWYGGDGEWTGAFDAEVKVYAWVKMPKLLGEEE